MTAAVRLRDLDPTGWALLLVGGWALFQAITIASKALTGTGGNLGIAALLGALAAASLWVVDHVARPELAGTCQHCGGEITVNTGADRDDMALTVPRAGSPERLGAGTLSIVKRRDYEEPAFCSPTCAQAFWDSQPTPTHTTTVVDVAYEPDREVEATATDGGDADEEPDAETVPAEVID